MLSEEKVAVEGRDYRNWMGELSSEAASRPLADLSLPGSHDSLTYSLHRGGGAGPDQPSCIRSGHTWNKSKRKNLNKSRRAVTRCFPRLSSHVLMRWSRTQGADLLNQLRGGVRWAHIGLFAHFLLYYCLYFRHYLYFLLYYC